MAFIKKEWKNRLVEFSGRRKLTRVAGSIDNQIVVDVTREEGTVSQQGDAFSEDNMNDLEQRIEDGFNDAIDKDNILNKEEVEANTEAGKHVADALVVKEIIGSLMFPDGTQFYADIQDGKPGFNTSPERGADTFVPFSSGLSVIKPATVFTENVEYTADKDYSKMYVIIDSALAGSASGDYTVNVAGSGNAILLTKNRLSNNSTGVTRIVGLYIYEIDNVKKDDTINIISSDGIYTFGIYAILG